LPRANVFFQTHGISLLLVLPETNRHRRCLERRLPSPEPSPKQRLIAATAGRSLGRSPAKQAAHRAHSLLLGEAQVQQRAEAVRPPDHDNAQELDPHLAHHALLG